MADRGGRSAEHRAEPPGAPSDATSKRDEERRFTIRALFAYPVSVFAGVLLLVLLIGGLPFADQTTASDLWNLVLLALSVTPFATAPSLPVGIVLIAVLRRWNRDTWWGYALGGAVCVNGTLLPIMLLMTLGTPGDASYEDVPLFVGAFGASGFLAGLVFWAGVTPWNRRHSKA